MTKQTKPHAIRGVALNAVNRGFEIAIQLVVSPIVVHGLGKERFGIWSIVQGMMTYLAITSLRGAGTKYLSQYRSGDDPSAVHRLTCTSVAANAILSAGMIAVSPLLALLFPYVFQIGPEYVTPARSIILVVGLSFAARFSGQTFAAHLASTARFDVINLATFTATVFQAVGTVVAVRLGGGLMSLAWVILAREVIEQAIYYFACKHILGSMPFSVKLFDPSMFRDLFKFASATLFIQFALRLTTRVGGLLIGYFRGPEAVAYYAIAEALVTRANSLGVSVTSVLLPIASRLDAEGRSGKLAEVSQVTSRVLLSVGFLLIAAFIVMGRTLIRLWMGEGFVQQTYPILAILTLAYVVKMSRDGLYTVLMALGKMRFLSSLAILDGFATVALGLILTYTMGGRGMAIASLAAQSLVVGIVMPVFARDADMVNHDQFILKIFLPAAAAAIPSLLLAGVLDRYAAAQSFPVFLAQCALVGVVAGVCCLYFCIGGELRRDVWSSFAFKRAMKSAV